MKIEEYLENLEKKELIYLFLAIPIVVFIVYYNFIYPKMDKEYKNLQNEQKKSEKKLLQIYKDIKKVRLTSKFLKQTKLKLLKLQDDFTYLEYAFDSLQIVQLNDKRVYNILTQLLQKSKELYLNNTFDIKWNNKPMPPYTRSLDIKITGNGNYISIIKYIQFIDYLKSLVFIKSIDIKDGKNNKLDFEITLSMVGVK